MKRAILIAAGTVAGTAAVLGYHPGTWFSTAAQATQPQPSSDQGSTAQAAFQQPDAPKTKTYTGKAFDPGYGPIKVKVTVTGSEITNITSAQQATDGKSQQIASYALPQLEQQAMAVQSTSIDGVSGASYTTQGFEQSLQSALTKAGLA